MPTRAAALRRLHAEPVSMRVLRWILLPLLVVHLSLATFSGYRAIWQIYSVTAATSTPDLRAGTVVTFGGASTGRAWGSVVCEIIQGTRHDTLGTIALPAHENPSYDPRVVRREATLTLTAAELAKLQAGPAILRVTGNGGRQWLRVPPPKIRDRQMEVVR